ncbi:MAG: NifU family protein, partial [Actinomycetota bacterium]|nr:NifU family protein [Actinomycetota bacterium]
MSGDPMSGAPVEEAPPQSFPELLARLEELFVLVESLEDSSRQVVFEFLDNIDLLHRTAINHLGAAVSDRIGELREDHVVPRLINNNGVGVDEHSLAEVALESIRPYIHSHGGEVEVLNAEAGVVHVRMSGACSGCTASAITLKQGVEDALREGFPGFVALT